ncbi:hypothetical protein FIV02_14835 [Pseudomonas sp. THAF187a]|uniref:Uncharacterized protein n=2 Tax=Ectopseudomonas TaxID=3236654 RepID=A0A653AY45_ECTOL|nr:MULTISPECIES: hypothetical protein [Pseudomonas]TNF12276.1 MAG: hypothetical protein EP327_08220 [Pseudomonadales bacterium]CAE6936246.1 conserved protein of unknown function [Pseudomonas oleovorans]QFT22847.1 hypothetical protein FIV02_14835 [Pseudomonas sp. THAF187a]QFT43034.1 hypothetical protein FIU98_14815 [Pseudomonas sp. THAF42]QTS84773.1 hypothetical protein JLK41_15745 [Pseudomonas khazarica]|tara:strand:+ start:9054 stop:9854 length:801 start_codon:yes stop_codon:yes gene_type:complete
MSENPAPAAQAPEDAAAGSETPAAPHPWSELPAEQFSLLRLAPLPVDRETGPRPLRFVQLGRVERNAKDLSLLRLTVQVPGQRLHRQQNLLEVWADHQRKEIRFGPDKGLSVEPANRGLGRFLMAQGIAWARKHFAHYQVEGGALPTKDNFNEAARERRDHALKAQGFTIEYSDPLQLKPFYSAPRVSSLHGDWQAEKVQIIELLDAAAMLQQADQNLQEQSVKLRKLEDRVDRLKREDTGLRFTITCLIAFSLFQAGLLIWIATR